MRMHVLGIGSIGTLLSHHLRLSHPNLPITLILKRPFPLPSEPSSPNDTSFSNTFPDDMDDHDPSIDSFSSSSNPTTQEINLSVTRSGRTTISTSYNQEIFSTSNSSPISSLLVCLKAPSTLRSLRVLAPRLSPSSVIALLQNGMGTYDELCDQIWPDPTTRPFFLIGTTTHGVAPTDIRGEVIHRSAIGRGEIQWGLVNDPRGEIDLESWIWGNQVSMRSLLDPPETPSLPLSFPPGTIGTYSNLDSPSLTLPSTFTTRSTVQHSQEVFSDSQNHHGEINSSIRYSHSPSNSSIPNNSSPFISSLYSNIHHGISSDMDKSPNTSEEYFQTYLPRTNLSNLHTTLSALLSLHHLSPKLIPQTHSNVVQSLKLAQNSIINPLTAILGKGELPNGALLNSLFASRMMRELAREISPVMIRYLEEVSDPIQPSDSYPLYPSITSNPSSLSRSSMTPGISGNRGRSSQSSMTPGISGNWGRSSQSSMTSGIPRDGGNNFHTERFERQKQQRERRIIGSDISRLFSPGILVQKSKELINNTKDNISSMAVDIKQGRETEIEYMNGWVIRMGKKYGMEMKVNGLVRDMIKFMSVMK
ncbi:hypothetical protein M231_07364 [Tremella mesenterica]|uniref:2-dehydropantoate 2-reductase n=1 Tax=Tremella mesenterica TaxID=5217 RepID=A0A4Q1BCF1_TREME|nr:hypothetical protein M231_07364 [Tremella mesenterica]